MEMGEMFCAERSASSEGIERARIPSYIVIIL